MNYFGPLLENWTPEQSARMNNAIFVAQHRLHRLDMFDDGELAKLIDNHPRTDLGINTMGSDPLRRDEWQEGQAGNLNGQDLLEAAQQGRIWLNLRRVMDHHPRYAELVNQLYDELEAACRGLHTFNRSANLLISSPTAMVFCHVDCPLNMLWHIRGTKRVWAYPLETGIVSDATLEATLSGDGSEEIAFDSSWDDHAAVFGLNPGEMITWPQHTPHRVENTSGLNVSLSTEHMTRRAVRKNNVYLANRHFRRLLPGEFHSTELTGARSALKEFALRVARRIPGLAPTPPSGYRYPITFEVDLNAPNCVRQLDEVSELEPVLS